jgi:cardiolipin synthase A/B
MPHTSAALAHSANDRPHTVRLLHSGREFFPALLQAIDGAQRSVYLETYIFSNDTTGLAVRDALFAAHARGVRIQLTIDGFGSGDQGRSLIAQCQALGIAASIYRPKRWWQAGLSAKLLRRLHRKLAVIDNELAFVGGINILDDFNHAPHHDPSLGARFDFAAQLSGECVAHVAQAMLMPSAASPSLRQMWDKPLALVLRDNGLHRQTIQKLYLKLLAQAKHDVWLANAYFVPGYKLRRAIISAARRGVQVHLLLQGRQEYFLQHHATGALYGQLLAAGVAIYEYQASFLHAKVAVADGQRATVGSSNIDPFSLMLAREANVLVNDAAFALELKAALQTACLNDAKRINPQSPRALWRRCVDWAAYGVLRLGLLVAVRQRY